MKRKKAKTNASTLDEKPAGYDLFHPPPGVVGTCELKAE
jgi:hypothetical protein